MKIGESMLPEFDYEMERTRAMLLRVPGDKLGWKPHRKSFSLGHLAGHLANIPTWIPLSLNQDSLDLAPGGVKLPPMAPPDSPQALLESFDKNVVAARAALIGAEDRCLFEVWSLLINGKTVLSMPRIAVLRSFVMNHLIHHRAQLTVYFRLLDIPVPSIYGPSADEGELK